MQMMKPTLPEGSVHGRFQPFHNEHLEYMLEAKKQCEFLWIGITKYDIDAEVSPLGRERDKPENNPLTYFERISIITEALQAKGIHREAFAFIPFPIEHETKLKQFLSSAVPCFTTICEPWNREKIEVLKRQGYAVRVLWEREKKITGSSIREQIINGEIGWHTLVPGATVAAVNRLNLGERLRQLRRRTAN